MYDILHAIQEIETFIVDSKDDFNAYRNDRKTQRAVERNIEIIGEAMASILQKNPTIELSHSKKIVDTRNRITHGYDSVSNEIIWGIATMHLPVLKREVELLLKES